MKKRNVMISVIMAAAIAASGCGSAAAGTAQTQTNTETAVLTETSLESFSSGNESETAAETESSAGGQTQTAAADMFTDRDYEADYDETNSVSIALNGSSASCEDAGVSIDGTTITIKEEGTYILSGSLEDGQIVVEAEDTAKVQLVLNGVSINSSSSAAIYVLEADKVFITLAEGTENTLSNGGSFTAIDENNIDAVIYAKDDITINGSGSLTVSSPAGHGIVSKDDLKVTGGSITVTAAKKGLSGQDSVRIADGSIQITAGTDGIYSENTEDTEKGYIYISGGNIVVDAADDGLHSSADTTIDGGTFTISVGDDGIHADATAIINDGAVTVADSYEGIEGLCIEINGGEINVTSSDDGLNAAGGNDGSGDAMFAMMENVSADSYLRINGGSLIVDASGDGLDSNGSLEMTGGLVYVAGPTNNGNGAMDYNIEATISGGTLVAAGASGMAENFSSADQGVMLVTVDGQNGGEITLTDSDGNVVVSWTDEKAYDSVLISSPQISEGETYTLTTGSYSQTITMDSLIYGSGMGMGGMMQGPGGQMGGMQGPGGQMGGMTGGPGR